MCFPIAVSPHIIRVLLCTITSLRISVHFHKYSNILGCKRLPINHTRSLVSPSILKKKKKERKQPNYNLIYHPEAGIIFHLSPNPPYSPFFLFPSSPPSPLVITHRFEMDPSRVSRSHVTVNDPRGEAGPRRRANPGEESPADGQFTFRQRRLSSGRCERKLDGVLRVASPIFPRS